jgi:hypothetical protein
MRRELEDILRRAEEGGSDLWHKARAQAVAGAQDAYQRGRQAYDDAIRAGQDVVARTPSEVAQLGRATNAAVRGTGNAISLNQADKLEALTEAGLGAGQGDFGQRYQQRLALQRQTDADLQREFPNLYKWSGRAGAVGAILAMDSPAVAAGVTRILPGGAKLVEGLAKFRPKGFIPEGYGRLAAGVGGTVNAAVQAGDDLAHGRPITLGNEADAFTSGAIGAATATRFGPAFGAAVGGALNTGLQEAQQGRPSTDDVLSSGVASAYAGRGFAAAGEVGSNALPSGVKGDLGEMLTYAKSWARGEPIPWKKTYSPAVEVAIPKANDFNAGPKVRIDLDNGRYTIPDFITDDGTALEAKFGLSARLSPSQRLALQKLGPLFQPDHWSPVNVGEMAGSAFGSGASGFYPPDGSQP